MKIVDWENKILKRYGFEKIMVLDDVKSIITNYKQTSFYCALKNEDLLLYLKTTDGLHYSGLSVLNGDNEESFDLFSKFLSQRDDLISPIKLSEIVDFFKSNGFSALPFNELTTEQQRDIQNDLMFKISWLTENEVSDEEFYAVYVMNFNGTSVFQENTGFNKNFVVIGSIDKINISSYYPMTNGGLTEAEFKDFIDLVSIDE